MLVRVTCGGILIGTAEFDQPEGVAHASLSPTPAYVVARSAARMLGERFARTQFWSPPDGDFAEVAAAGWEGGRLAIEDVGGRELGVANVVVLDGLPSADGESLVHVVADFRADLGRVASRARSGNPADGNRTRPAA